MLLSFDNWNATILNAVANLFLPSSPVEALIGTFEIRLLQSRIIKDKSTSHQVKEVTNDGNEDPEEKEIIDSSLLTATGLQELEQTWRPFERRNDWTDTP